MDIDEAVRLLRFWAIYDKFPRRVEAVDVLLQAYERDRAEIGRLRDVLGEMLEGEEWEADRNASLLRDGLLP